ncbi:hypothetical protein J3Q64DRAFT_1823787 [Phycomyces blakesleeanus]|uniref:GYF domain-containing protein n=1 Tax=Phycomyces blakesleeanus TaxID=4837 RepID=A0ABR3ATC8_PHYBL
MTTNMNFGPEWMRGSFPKRPNNLDSQSMRSMSPNASTTLPRTNSSNNINSFSLANHHSQVSDSNNNTTTSNNNNNNNNNNIIMGLENNSNSNSNSNMPFGGTLSGLSTPLDEVMDLNPFKYSKEFMLSLYKPTELPLGFEKHEYVAVEECQGPLSFVDLSENERKLLSGPVHSEMSRRIITGEKNERTDRTNNGQRNHRDTYASPMHSPAVENAPITPGRLNLARTKGRVGDYFQRDRDQYGGKQRTDGGVDTPRRREFSQSSDQNIDDSFGSLSKGIEDGQDEMAWGGASKDTLGSFDNNGVFRSGGSGETLEKDWQSESILEGRNKDGRVTGAGAGTGAGTGTGTGGFRHQTDDLNNSNLNSLREYLPVSSPFDSVLSDHAPSFARSHTLGGSSAFGSDLTAGIGGIGGIGGNNSSNGRESPAAAGGLFGTAGLTGTPGANASSSRKPLDQYKWFYRDPAGNVQGPFDATEMQEWYKAGFFSPSLLVKREDESLFEPLVVLTLRGLSGDPFGRGPSSASSSSAGNPLFGSNGLDSAGLLNGGGLGGGGGNVGNGIGGVGGSVLFGTGSPATDHLSGSGSAGLNSNNSNKYHPFGGVGNFLNQPMGSNPGTPQSPSILQGSFNGFGSSLLGSRDSPSTPWGDVPRTPSWLNNTNQNDLFGSANPLGGVGVGGLQQSDLQNPLQPALFKKPGLDLGGKGSPVIRSAVAVGSANWGSAPGTPLGGEAPSSPWGSIVPPAIQNKISDELSSKAPGQQQQQQQQQQTSRVSLSPQVKNQTNNIGQQKDSLDAELSRSIEENRRREEEISKAMANFQIKDNEADQTKSQQQKVNKQQEQQTQEQQESFSGQQEQKQETQQKQKSQQQQTQDQQKRDVNGTAAGSKKQQQNQQSSQSSVESTYSAPAVKPVSLREIQAEEMKKQEEIKQQQQQQQQQAKAAINGGDDVSSGVVGNGSGGQTKTSGWASAPWARDGPAKGPSLREIQELEAKEAEMRKEAAEKQTAAYFQSGYGGDDSISSAWGGIVTGNKNNGGGAASASGASTPTGTSNGGTMSPAWGTTAAPKKTLREIQQEEEAALKKKAKAQQAAAASYAASNSNLLLSTSLSGLTGKGYAGVASSASPKTAVSGGAWTTVTNSRAVSKILSGSGMVAAGAATASPAPISSSSRSATSNVGGSGSASNSGGWETVGVKSTPAPAPVAAAAPVRTSVVRKSTHEPESKQPSEEFTRWCRQALRGLNSGVNEGNGGDEIMQMLLSFPLDKSSAEIIQDMIYANSTSMDGRRFSEEFMKRRKADMAGNLTAVAPSTAFESAAADDSFQVVITKKGKKKQQQ